MGQAQLGRLNAIQQVFNGFGNDRNAVDINDLQGAMRLMQIRLGMAQRGGLGFGVLRNSLEQRHPGTGKRFTDFTYHPRQWAGIEVIPGTV